MTSKFSKILEWFRMSSFRETRKSLKYFHFKMTITCCRSWCNLADLFSPCISETARPTRRFIRIIETRIVNRKRKKWAVTGNTWVSTLSTKQYLHISLYLYFQFAICIYLYIYLVSLLFEYIFIFIFSACYLHISLYLSCQFVIWIYLYIYLFSLLFAFIFIFSVCYLQISLYLSFKLAICIYLYIYLFSLLFAYIFIFIFSACYLHMWDLLWPQGWLIRRLHLFKLNFHFFNSQLKTEKAAKSWIIIG